MSRKLIYVFIFLLVLAFVFIAGGEAGERLAGYPEPLPQGFEGVPILMYHKVNPDPGTGGYGLRVHPRNFEKQISYLLKSGFTAISLTDLADHYEKGSPLPPRPVIITFDDGYMDNYTYAYPILKKHGMTATVFVVAGTVGGINEFDYNAGRQPKNKMADWTQLKEMAGGGMTIGAHTLRHPHLGDLNPEDVKTEITGSKMILEKELNRPVKVFCYPYGSYNETAAALVKESGFRAAVTTSQGLGRFDREPFELKRIRIRGDYTLNRFAEELAMYSKN